MKKNRLFILGMLALLLTFSMFLIGCADDDPDDTYKIIAQIYRFTTTNNGLLVRNPDEWHPSSNQKSVAVTVGADSISWTGAATGSHTEVYSEGGGNCVYTPSGDPGTWTFLYKHGMKIGIVFYIPDYQGTGPRWSVNTGIFFNTYKNQNTYTTGYGIPLSELGEDANDYPAINAGRYTGW